MPLQLEQNGNSPLLGELGKAKAPLLDPQNQRNQCLVTLHAQRSVLKGVAVMQKMWASLHTRMGSSQGVSDVAGWCPGARRGTLGSLNSSTGESPVLPWGGARQWALIWGGAQSTNHSPKKQVSAAHKSVLSPFHAKGQWGSATGCFSNSSFSAQLQLCLAQLAVTAEFFFYWLMPI